ncbi:Lactate dehydrogenase [Quadrisphaera granulorum]|uniref:Lactate dehydrogenase-like 2-hydroxyacid dehydrogenase n=1 Tax=Quadrisphaera granulorum TaxID=317664 RepID=A0A315ZZP0_9ACTN|nr:D-2-hydroxyacid dehydrogenase family protein [Quadrisphaera granulorum]PWJ51126.1 lactate dehydrogenase-like 2-hydroxyacid dehydrogenase [Quadrisphaera granulorum]SZE97776.1 Lactate dehydrogenase [Quadrisphaera granulorum]
MRIVLLDDYQHVALDCADWGSLPDDVDVDVVHQHLTGSALRGALAGATVVVAMRERTPFDAALLADLPDLRLLVTTAMGNAAIDLDACRARGVVVCGTGMVEPGTAELTWALLLALVKQVPRLDAGVRAGAWQQRLERASGIGGDLAGGVLGVVGLGKLGQRVARVAQAFDMHVIAWSQHLDPDLARSLGVEPTTKDDLLARSDAVTLHLKLSERSRGIIGARELALMKPGALLVNTSRGPLVDEAALLEALHSGHLGGAGLDVFDEEPLPHDHPLRTAPRTVLTPHVGYVTETTYRTFYGEALEDVVAWLAGAPVRVLT